ncbi:MAG: DUF6370 family protein [Gemmataceae bacterium]|nr:DUF6370 family protein [Gemmata sp.]MDW8196677.1 DUF6370 family protein [Gemmataceae bacterium]
MVRIALLVAFGFAVIGLSQNATISAQDKKAEVKKFEGTLTCTKCALGETKACGHALIVKEGDKDVKYYLQDKGAKEPYHKECCTADVKAVITGKPGEKDGKKIIEEPKVEVKK